MSDVVAALEALRGRVRATELVLDLEGAEGARRTRTELLDQIDDYLLPRLARLDAPLLVVLGGSTGAGKSTITNTLVGAEVSPSGVLRPTTRVPVLVCHPVDEPWFAGDGVLPDLPRTTGARPASAAGLHLVVSEAVPAGVGYVDAPDIDSVELANHDLAAQLLGAADLWLFVTTAARYADAVPWAYLARARERSMALALVVNRIPPGAASEVTAHLAEMLGANGLGDARLFAVDEADLVDGRLPEHSLAEVRSWLDGLVADAGARRELVRATIDGALASVPTRVARLTSAVRSHAAAVETLRASSRHAYDEALATIEHELDAGTLLRGEVLDRWREHVGTGELMDRLQRGVTRVRDRLKAVFTGSELPSAAAQGQLESNLEVLIRQCVDQAALATVERWEVLPGGTTLLAAAPRGIDRAGPDLAARVSAELEAWQDAVLGLVRDQAGNRLAVARTLSLGINGVGVALMIAVFSQTGGLTGGEAGVAAGTAAVSQAVLTAVFGEQAVRTLVRQARDDLHLRLAGLFDEDRRRFEDLLAVVPDTDAARALDEAAATVAAERR